MCDVNDRPPALPPWDVLLAEIWDRSRELESEIELWLSGYDARPSSETADFARSFHVTSDGRPKLSAFKGIDWLREYMTPSEISVFDRASGYPLQGLSAPELEEMRQACVALKDRAADAYRKLHEIPVRAPVRAPDQPPVRANTFVKFSAPEPTQTVKNLAFKLASRGDKSMNETACEFTGGDESKAGSLLAQIRRLERQGRIIFGSN